MDTINANKVYKALFNQYGNEVLKMEEHLLQFNSSDFTNVSTHKVVVELELLMSELLDRRAKLDATMDKLFTLLTRQHLVISKAMKEPLLVAIGG